MTQYKFADIDLPNIYGVSAPTPLRVGTGTPIMKHGGYTGRRFIDARQINMQGVWLPTAGQTFSEMELSYSTFLSTLVTAGKSRLFLRKNWFYNAILKDCNEGKREIGSIEFDLQFYVGDPRQYKLGTDEINGTDDSETTLGITWDTSFNTPPGIWTPIKLLLAASAGYVASIEITPKYGPSYSAGESLIWKPPGTGLTTVYLEEQRASRSGIDVTSTFDGNFFDVNPNSVMKIASTPAINNISASIIYREALL